MVVEVVPVVLVRCDREVGGDCLEGPALCGTAELVGVEPRVALQWRPAVEHICYYLLVILREMYNLTHTSLIAKAEDFVHY